MFDAASATFHEHGLVRCSSPRNASVQTPPPKRFRQSTCYLSKAKIPARPSPGSQASGTGVLIRHDHRENAMFPTAHSHRSCEIGRAAGVVHFTSAAPPVVRKGIEEETLSGHTAGFKNGRTMWANVWHTHGHTGNWWHRHHSEHNGKHKGYIPSSRGDGRRAPPPSGGARHRG